MQLAYRLESPDGRGAFQFHGCPCSGELPYMDGIPEHIFCDKRYHYGVPQLPQFRTWWNPWALLSAARNGLQISLLNISDADPFHGRSQVAFLRHRAKLVAAFCPVTFHRRALVYTKLYEPNEPFVKSRELPASQYFPLLSDVVYVPDR